MPVTGQDKPPSCLRQGRRRVKVFGQTFFKKFAVGKAEPYGLKSNAKRCKRKTRETGGPGPQWGPFRTGLRCHFGRCWASATGRQHPRRQPRSSAFPGRQDSPLRRAKPIKQEAQERPGLLFFSGISARRFQKFSKISKRDFSAVAFLGYLC